MSIPISDLHIHPGLKGYPDKKVNENTDKTIWDYYPPKKEALDNLNRFVRGTIKEMAKESQANLDACVKSDLVAPFIAIYPVERQMFNIQPRKPFKLLLNLILPRKKYVDLGTAVSGFPRSLVQKILDNNVFDKSNRGIDYFKEYLGERDYILNQTSAISKRSPGHRFRIATNYEEFVRFLEDGKTICGILTVEGAHSFGHYLYDSTFLATPETLKDDERKTLEESILSNIRQVKTENGGKHAPFFVTFCHHFNNLLGGHARSMSAKSNLIPFLNWPNLPGMRHLFNQETFLAEGPSELGKKAIELILDRSEGRRMLIDTKHMSVKMRRAYYEGIREKRAAGDHIPIICSHTAVSGWTTLAEAELQPESKNVDKKTYFSRWQINLTDEDILETFDSDGLLGILLHEGRMPGNAFKKKAKKLKKAVEKKKDKNAYAELKDMYLQMVWSNFFHIARVVHRHRSADGWGMINLGSDYDGLVDPFNTYENVISFSTLFSDLLAYFRAGKTIYRAQQGYEVPLSLNELHEILRGRDPEELLKDIFFGNVKTFLSKYFTEEYLKGSSGPPPAV